MSRTTEDPDNVIEVAEDDSWVFESLVNFIHGPIWKLPILGFIEEKSVVFDPNSFKSMTDEKEEEYRKIHEEYKALVDFMLANFMEDIHVTPEQIEEACKTGEPNKTQVQSFITKVALEQLWAAEDFNAFRRLMTRKNIDLQLQSLELLVAKFGVLSPSLRNEDSGEGDEEEKSTEDEFLQVVIRYTDMYNVLDKEMKDDLDSRANKKAAQLFERNCTEGQSLDTDPIEDPMFLARTDNDAKLFHSQTQSQTNDLDPITAQLSQQLLSVEFPKDSLPMPSTDTTTTSTVSQTTSEVLDVESERQIQQQELQDDLYSTGKGSIPAKPQKPNKPNKSGSSGPETIATSASVEKVEISSVTPERHHLLEVRKALESSLDDNDLPPDEITAEMIKEGIVTEADIRRRREYMRNQRDKLVELKRKERERQLAIADGSGSASTSARLRPKSTKAARTALTSTPQMTGSERTLAARRALANRLRQELNEQH